MRQLLAIVTLTFMALLENVAARCSIGCMRCDPTDQCLYCDLSSNYVLTNGTCVQSFSNNCLKLNLNGTCQNCASGFYPNSNLVCVATATNVPNCAVMRSQTTCKYCQTGYYVSNNICIPVANIVDGCQYYLADGLCQVCQPNFYLFFDLSMCILLNRNASCLAYSQTNCFTCNKGFVMNRNTFLENIKIRNWDQVTELLYVYNNNLLNLYMPICNVSIVTGCSEYGKDGSCLLCQSGMNWVNGSCYNQTVTLIENCKIVSLEGVCLQCSDVSFWDGSRCVPLTPVPNCVTYKTTNATNSSDFVKLGSCIACTPDYYAEWNACRPRTASLSMQFCNITHPWKDACLQCNNGYNATSDERACLPMIRGCSKYKTSFEGSAKLTCETCISGLYPNDYVGGCTPDSASKCDLVLGNTDSCIKCADGYYLQSDFSCEQEIYYGVISCLKWSPNIPHFCTDCPSNTVKFSVDSFCINPIQTIENCQVYDSSFQCATCQPPYVVDSTKTQCLLISSSEFCQSVDANEICSQCGTFNNSITNTMLPTYLDQSYNCQLPDLRMFQNCTQIAVNVSLNNTVLNPNGAFVCRACQPTFYPVFLQYFKATCLSFSSYRLGQGSVATKLPNCAFFDLINGVCLQCASGFYVFSGVCVVQCPVGMVVVANELVRDVTNGQVYVNRRNYCDVSIALDCTKMDVSTFSFTKTPFGDLYYGCVACADNSAAIIKVPPTTVPLGASHAYSSSSQVRSPNNRFMFISGCLALSTVSANIMPSASTSNCKYFIQIGANYGCFTCNFGYSGRIAEDTTSGYNGYIPTCSQMTTCQTQTYYTGLGGLPQQTSNSANSVFSLPMELYVTCHKCIDPSLTVAFEVSFGQTRASGNQPKIGQLSPWDITTPAIPTYSMNTNTQTTCINNLYSWFLPPNCGVILVNSDSSPIGYLATNMQPTSLTSVFCIACKIGFFPNVTNEGWVFGCNQLFNCQVSEWNGCKVCKRGYAFGYNIATNRIDNTVCQTVPSTSNCYAGYFIAGSFFCVICNKGYISSPTGYCQQLTIPGCESYTLSSSFSFPDFSPYGISSYDWLTYIDPILCSQCANSQLVLDYNSSPFCILNNEFLDSNNTLPIGFPVNCQAFKMNINGTLACNLCNNNYTLFKGQCYMSNFTGNSTVCDVYDSKASACLKCPDYYFLIYGFCFQGILDKCVTYNSLTSCAKCQNGFAAVEFAPGRTICVNVTNQSNCSVWNEQKLQKGVFDCTVCPNGTARSTSVTEIPRTLCLPVSLIPNCATHNVTLNSLNSTFECTACNFPFFLNQTYCLVQQYVENCVQYHPSSKACLVCDLNYMLSKDGLQCLRNITTISQVPNCQTYFDGRNCLFCLPGYYLKDGLCLRANFIFSIENCVIYADSRTCKRCQTGYYSSGSKCLPSSATNCLDYESPFSCASCPAGYGLDNGYPYKNCIPLNLANCTIPNTLKPFPFECLSCSGNNYIDPISKKCLPVKAPILFCLAYSSDTTCSACESSLTLSPDFQYCYGSSDVTNSLDPNCYSSALVEIPVCNVCAPGYFMENDWCTPCQNNMLFTGCLFCDPTDNDKCLLCATNYYMDSKGNCVSNPGAPIATSS